MTILFDIVLCLGEHRCGSEGNTSEEKDSKTQLLHLWEEFKRGHHYGQNVLGKILGNEKNGYVARDQLLYAL